MHIDAFDMACCGIVGGHGSSLWRTAYDDKITTRARLRYVGKCSVAEREAAFCTAQDGMSCCLHIACADWPRDALYRDVPHTFDACFFSNFLWHRSIVVPVKKRAGSVLRGALLMRLRWLLSLSRVMP
jgi:hypothetical protein